MKINSDEIVRLLTEGELTQAIQQLVLGTKYSEQETDVALLSLRINTLNKEIDRETIEASAANIERNKITVSMLELVRKIKEDFVASEVIFSKILFFETPKIMKLKAERVYAKEFVSSKTQYIGWELDVKYPKTTYPFTFLVEWQLINVDTNTPISAKLQKEIKISEGWSASWHYASWGSENLGNWSVGNKRLEITIDDQLIIADTFKII
jgi:hypothetical protein